MAQRLVRLPGITATDALRAVLSLLPLDDFVDQPAAAIGLAVDEQAAAARGCYQRAVAPSAKQALLHLHRAGRRGQRAGRRE